MASALGSQQRAWRDAELPLEESREVRLISEAGAEGDVGQRRAGRLEQTTRALEPERHEMLMRRAAHGFLERAREMGG